MLSSNKKRFVILATLNASLGIVHYAYVTVVFNSALKLIKEYAFTNLDTSLLSLMASSPFLGGLIGAAITKYIGQRLGRRSTLIFADIISIIGTLLTMAFNFPVAIVGRTLTGVTAGIATVVTSIYIAEISNGPLRDQLGMIPNIAFSFGPILSFILGSFVALFIKQGIPGVGYRILMVIPGIISIIKIFNFLVFFKFETPFFLVSQGKEEEAKEVLSMISDEDPEEQLQEMIHERNAIFGKESIQIKDLFKKRYRLAFFIALAIYVSPFTTGQIIPLTFSNLIFSDGVGSLDSTIPTIMTNLVGVFNCLGSFGSLLLIKYYGKRQLALYGYLLILICNASITVICYTDSISSMAIKVIILSLIFIFAISTRPMSYSYPAETLPEIGVVMVVTIKWIAGFAVIQAFLVLRAAIWYSGIYAIFTGFTILIVLIISFYMIETKGKTKLDALKKYGSWKDEEERNVFGMEKKD